MSVIATVLLALIVPSGKRLLPLEWVLLQRRNSLELVLVERVFYLCKSVLFRLFYLPQSCSWKGTITFVNECYCNCLTCFNRARGKVYYLYKWMLLKLSNLPQSRPWKGSITCINACYRNCRTCFNLALFKGYITCINGCFCNCVRSIVAVERVFHMYKWMLLQLFKLLQSSPWNGLLPVWMGVIATVLLQSWPWKGSITCSNGCYCNCFTCFSRGRKKGLLPV